MVPYRTTPKMAARKERRRNMFLEVGLRLFAEHGYHHTTVPMVVEASDSSTGSFYFYFDNKEDLFVQVLQEAGDRLDAALNEALARHEDTRSQMRAAVEELFLFLSSHPDEARILLVETSGLGGRPETVRQEIVGSHVRSVEGALDSLIGEDRGDPAVLAHCWVGAVYEAARHWLALPADERADATEVATQVANFNLAGVGVR